MSMTNRCDSSAASAVWWAFVSEFAEAAACRCEAHPDSSTLSGSNRKASFFICFYLLLQKNAPPREGSVAGGLFYRGSGAVSRSVLLFPFCPALLGPSCPSWSVADNVATETKGVCDCNIRKSAKLCKVVKILIPLHAVSGDCAVAAAPETDDWGGEERIFRSVPCRMSDGRLFGPGFEFTD